MTKEELQKQCTCGISEDINGKFYQLYDFDKIWEYVTSLKKEEDNGIVRTCNSCKFYRENPRCSTGEPCDEWKEYKKHHK